MHTGSHNLRAPAAAGSEESTVFRTLIESNADGILIVDQNGLIRFVNPSAESLLGRSSGGLIGVPFGFPLSLHQPLELDILQPGGHFRVAEMRMVEVEWEREGAYLASLRDITDRKMAERREKQQRKFLEILLETIPTPVFYKDLSGRYLGCNHAFEEFLGRSRSDIIGKTVYDMAPEEIAEKYHDMDQELIRGPSRQSYEWKVPSRDGRLRDVIFNKTTFCDELGRLAGIIGSITDISEHNSIEAERREMERQLLHAQKLESLGVLAGGIAHDFNNLLMIMLGYLEMAQEDIPMYHSAQSSLDQAIRAAHRAAHLVRQMLAYAGKGRYIVSTSNLNKLLEENLDLPRASVSEKIAFDIRLDPALPDIEADPEQIQQVIVNLVSNATEAIGEQSGVVRICTGVQGNDGSCCCFGSVEEKAPQGRFAYIEVTDTGCGMGEETRLRLFDPFFSTKFAGRGLGMAAVMGIVRGHKGAILVDSQEGKGSRVRVLFPLPEVTIGA